MKLTLRKQAGREGASAGKLDAENSPQPVSEEYTRLPIRQCEPHPDLVMRLDYGEGIDGLSESIRANGQQVPGMAIEKPDGSGFWVIAGNRRLRACKLLFEKYGEPSSYKALLFHGLTKEEIYSKAIVENESERGERKNLSVVEEVAFLTSIREALGDEAVVRIGVRAGKNEQSVRKRLFLAEELGGEGMLKKLYQIERRCDFSFKLSHLEALAKHAYDQELLLRIAAIAAASKMSPEEVDPKAAPSLLRYSAPWFYELFTELKRGDSSTPEPQGTDPEQGNFSQSVEGKNVNPAQQPTLAQGGAEHGDTGPEQGEEEDEKNADSAPVTSLPLQNRISIVAQGTFFAKCPDCGTENPFHGSGLTNIERKIELVFYDLSKKKEEGQREGPEKKTVSPTIILAAPTECSKCSNQFWLDISPRGQGIAAIQSFKEKTFSEPTESQKECTLAYDSRLGEPDGWVIISGETKYGYREGRRVELTTAEKDPSSDPTEEKQQSALNQAPES
jgi:hypothetical protein